MFCPKCGKINPDNESLCSGCGATLQEEAAPKKTSGGKKRLKIALTFAVVAIIIVAAVMFLNGCSKPTENISF